MLPALKALRSLDCRISLYLDADYKPSKELWRRCRYADEVHESPEPVPAADEHLSGHWRPAAFGRFKNVIRYRFQNEPYYDQPEWSLALGLARHFGWTGDPPDVSDWCLGLKRIKQYDYGLVPGSKGGEWLRKRYPGMRKVAEQLQGSGRTVALFGQASDGLEGIPGDLISSPLERLPDALALCRVVIGTDSGPTHLASSLGIPTIVIYTSTSDVKGEPVGRPAVKITAPVSCRPCQATPRWWNCADWICRQIDPEAVVEVGENLLCEYVLSTAAHAQPKDGTTGEDLKVTCPNMSPAG